MNATIDQPGPIRAGEELDEGRLEKFLLQHLPASTGPLTIEQFPSGFSNLTYLLRLGDREWVLRRPPFGNQVKTAHDMGREYRVLSRLCDVYPPAPRPALYCNDPAVLGDEFYVMERRVGVVLRGSRPPSEMAQDPQLARRVGEAFVDSLAELHSLDVAAAGLDDLGKPDGYVQRQVAGWTNRYARAKTDDFPEVDQLTAWLSDHIPAESRPAIIHNDYKYDNLLLDPADLTRIVAVLDWEMATIGDPLMDLGGALAYWVEPSDSTLLRQSAFGPTACSGSLTRQEILSRYVTKTGLTISDPLFYYAFGLLKLLVIVQQIFARYQRGHTRDPRFATLNSLVATLATAGVNAIHKGSI